MKISIILFITLLSAGPQQATEQTYEPPHATYLALLQAISTVESQGCTLTNHRPTRHGTASPCYGLMPATIARVRNTYNLPPYASERTLALHHLAYLHARLHSPVLATYAWLNGPTGARRAGLKKATAHWYTRRVYYALSAQARSPFVAVYGHSQAARTTRVHPQVFKATHAHPQALSAYVDLEKALYAHPQPSLGGL